MQIPTKFKKPLYSFEDCETTLLEVADANDEPNVYGKMIHREGDLRIRACGWPSPMFSLWTGPKLVKASYNFDHIERIVNRVH